MPLVETVRFSDFFLKPRGRLAFQNLHDVEDRVLGGCQDAEVNVVVLNAQLDDLPALPLADGLEDSQELLLHLRRSKHLAPILRCPNQMVFEVVEITVC